MKYIKKNIVEIASVIILGIIFCIILIGYTIFNNTMRDNCIKKGGTAIDNEMGRFEKCVYK